MGITSREDIAIVSKDLKNSRGTNFAPRKIQFAHEFTGGETSLNLLSLTTPTDLAGAGFVNASPSEIASAHLSVFGKNLRLSLSRGLELKPFAHYLISGNSVIFRGSLRDSGGAMPGEILFGEIDSVSSSGLVVGDVRFEHGTIEVIEGQTSVSIGYPFKVNANPSEQVGDLKLWRNGVRIYRNVGNAAASPSADGNYHEVDSGTGYGTTIELNSAPVGQSDIIEFEVGLKIASGDMSTWDALERLEGSILALAGDVKDLGPFDITRYIAAAPSAIERKAFGDMVFTLKEAFESEEIKYQTKSTTGNHTTNAVVPELTFNNLVVGKTYRCTFEWKLYGTNGTAHNVISNQGGISAVWRGGDSTTQEAQRTATTQKIFVATSSTLTFTGTNLGADRYLAAGSNVTLEELNKHTTTAQWT